MDGSLRLLGSLQLSWRGADVPVTVLAGRALLAYLALEADQPHSREMLAALLWPDKPHKAGLTNLRQTLARLRATVPDLDAIIQIGEQTLQLNPVLEIDVAGFQQLLATVATHPHLALADCPACVARLQAALQLYRGELLEGLFIAANLPFEEWMLFRREQLHQQALLALDTLTQVSEALGDYEGMREYAARQVALEPWRELAHLQLIRALSLLDQRAAALAQYEKCLQILQAELGVEPMPELRELGERIRRGDAAIPATLSAGPHHNLPLQLTPLVGREREMTRIAATLQDPELRLLTLTGAGGIGKTRLALEVARAQVGAYNDGPYFVVLAPLSSGDALPSAIAAALGLRIDGDLQAALFHTLRERQMLLIMDNFEHLISSAAFVADLLAAVPGLTLLVTSREQLNLRGEYVFTVEALEYASNPASNAAARLFAQAARRAAPDFELNEATGTAVGAICRQLEGIPLALELAAAWVGALSLAEIGREIAGSADFLAAEWRDAPSRQRSMRAVFDWSWALLNAEERRVLAALSVFRGGFSREAAQEVAGASLALLTRLLRKSLLNRSDGGAAGRYEMHELLRQFAAEYFARDPAQQQAVAARHSEFYLGFVAAREWRFLHDEPRQATAEIRRDLDNVRLAWNWATANLALHPLERSIYPLVQFAWQAGLSVEWSSMAALAIERVGAHLARQAPGTPEWQAAAILWSKLVPQRTIPMYYGDDFDAALTLAGQVQEVAQAGGSAEGQVFAVLHQSHILFRRGDYAAAERRLEQTLQLIHHYRAAASELEVLGFAEWITLFWLSLINSVIGNFAVATRYVTAALELCQRERRLVGELTCLLHLAHLGNQTRDLAAARRYGERALQLIAVAGSRWEEAAVRLDLGEIARLQGDYDQAIAQLERTRTIAREINIRMEEAIATAYLARLHSYCGDFSAAQQLLADFQHHGLGSEPSAEALTAIAQALLLAGAAEQALDQATAAYQLAQKISAPVIQAHALVVLGHAQAALHLSAARESYSQALQLYAPLANLVFSAEPQAGLARLALAAGEPAAALSYVETLLTTLAEYPRAGLDEPFQVYHTCYDVLAAAQDPRAHLILQTAQRIICEYADQIATGARRQSFSCSGPKERKWVWLNSCSE